jgi:tRNA A-37 threonylcarbamoyl transferase component Bud32
MSECKGKNKQLCQTDTNNCVWVEGKVRQYCKSAKKPSNTKEQKSCKKVSASRCAPHSGKMDPGCSLSDKNRCIILKTSSKTIKKKPIQKKKTNDKIEKSKKSSDIKVPKPVQSATVIKGNKGDIGVQCNNWVILKQLGKSGKEGTTFEVEHSDTKVRAAMKQFKDKKSTKTFEKEVEMQKMAQPLSPIIYDQCIDPPRLVMEKMSMTLPELIIKQGNKLSDEQQLSLIKLCEEMNKTGVMHNDPNPLNIMVDDKGNFRFIDFGMSKPLSKIKKSNNKKIDNVSLLYGIFYSGMQGLTNKLVNKKDLKIINDKLEEIGAMKKKI